MNHYGHRKKIFIAVFIIGLHRPSIKSGMGDSPRPARICIRLLSDNDGEVYGHSATSQLRSGRHQTIMNIEESIDSYCTLEILYKITDIVLILCAAIFIVSAIAYNVLWITGAALP